jgi:hypothetical protein
MKHAHAWPGVVLVLFLAVFGCSRGDLQSYAGCSPGVSECVSDRLLRVCPEDGAGYLAFPCAADETCRAGACIGPCETGVSSCISKDVLRLCTADGKASTAVACPIGSVCQNGRCNASKTEPLCDAGEWACATEAVGKECERDGLGWVMTPCALGERCSTEPGSQRCVPNASAATCEPGKSVCLDGAIALHCSPDGSGYAVQSCPATAPCLAGACRGSVCAIGEAQCAPLPHVSEQRDSVLTCVDGESWEYIPCGRREICVFDGIAPSDAPALASWWGSGQTGSPPVPLPAPLTASCRPANCLPFNGVYGNPVCGDPTNPALDSNRYFSRCEGFAPFSGYEWVPYRCPDLTECLPPGADSDIAYCSSACLSGQVRCAGDRHGVEICNQANQWNAVEACEKGQLCATLNGGQTACIDAECAYFMNRGIDGGGRCETAGRFRPCGSDGLLGDVDATCRHCQLDESAVTTPSTATYGPGTCAGPAGGERCTVGDRTCSTIDQYWQCTGTNWSSAELHRCPTGTLCFPGLDLQTGDYRAVCAECAPGSTQCNDDGTIEYCDVDGNWQGPTKCAVGSCKWGIRADGSNGYGCRTQCLPDSVLCTSPTEYQKCGADGQFATTSFTCEGGNLCHTGGGLPDVGCAECVGPTHDRHATSVADSRCEGNALVECLPNDTWGPARECTGNTQCQQIDGAGDDWVWARCAPR